MSLVKQLQQQHQNLMVQRATLKDQLETNEKNLLQVIHSLQAIEAIAKEQEAAKEEPEVNDE